MGGKTAWIPHLIGVKKCLYATEEARECTRMTKDSNSGSEHTATSASTKHARSKSASDQPQKQTKALTPVQMSIKLLWM